MTTLPCPGWCRCHPWAAEHSGQQPVHQRRTRDEHSQSATVSHPVLPHCYRMTATPAQHNQPINWPTDRPNQSYLSNPALILFIHAANIDAFACKIQHHDLETVISKVKNSSVVYLCWQKQWFDKNLNGMSTAHAHELT